MKEEELKTTASGPEKKAVESFKDFAKSHRFALKNLAWITKAMGNYCFGSILALTLFLEMITALAVR